MEPDHALPRQLILPTDKRNPSFTLYRLDEGKLGKSIQVYYGLELMEVVPDNAQDPLFRCMLARLYNANVKLKTLAEVFSVDPKTIRSWGAALRSQDPAQIQVMLFGHDAGRKRTTAIDSFVRHRLPQLLDEGCRNYRETLQQEIEKVFDIRLSGETLRVIMASVRSEEVLPANPAAQPPVEVEAPSDAPSEAPSDAPSEAPSESLSEVGGTLPSKVVACAAAPDSCPTGGVDAPLSSKEAPFF
jgi:hypothetical protein